MRRTFIGITSGLRGYFAILYDADGPIKSGIGSYKTAEEAKAEAVDWAESEGLPLDWIVFPRKTENV